MSENIYVIGNWKMNKHLHEVTDFFDQFNISLHDMFASDNSANIEIGVAPAAIHLPQLSDATNFSLVAQNIASEENGAYTGEISASMVAEYSRYVLVGHSERRMFFNESNDILIKKIMLAYKYNLIPIFCFGENLENREKGDYLSIIKQQIEKVIFPVFSSSVFLNQTLIVAYEPVWAIGTGKHASPEQISEVHDYARNLLIDNIGNIKGSVPILYGGSCNSQNAKSILEQKNVNGLLIGGASLDVDHFTKIIQIAHGLS
ncbi:MAG: triose-phosphate isomerase [Flavobacteriales bacterium]|nr:triose-phosphate isomerase [Flavobacteriales bacterium]|tara:strand:- start:732 stop:1511 length:780 start_codon:yes stop_codon:yes gene_type:complete